MVVQSLEQAKSETVSEVDLTVNTITEPLDSYRVGEGYFAVAEYSRERPYIITYGLSVCKGIVMYDPDKKRGLVAHLAWAEDAETSLSGIVDSYEDSLQSSDVLTVQTSTEGNPEYWPTLESVTELLLRHNPRSLAIDKNTQGTWVRGIALHLGNGQVSEIDPTKAWRWSKEQDTSRNLWIPAAGTPFSPCA